MDPPDCVEVSQSESVMSDDYEGRSRPSSELPLHAAIYAGTDAGAIVHTHSHYATVLGTLVDELPAVHYTIIKFGGAVRVARYETFGTEELAASVIDALKDRSAALMANHGAIVAGREIEGAVSMAIHLEWLASIYYHSILCGTPSILSDGELDAVRDRVRQLELRCRGWGAMIDEALALELRDSHPRVACVGTYIVDVLGRPVSDLPRGQVSSLLDEIRMTAAGTAGGTSVDLARMGADVIAIGAIGRDNIGDFLVSALHGEGVDPSYLVRKDGVQTSATILPIHPDGSRPAWHVRGANSSFTLDDVPWEAHRRMRCRARWWADGSAGHRWSSRGPDIDART